MTDPMDDVPEPVPHARPVCSRCNEVHVTRFGTPACVAHSKATGDACRNAPVTGATVCRRHGAAKGTRIRTAADRRIEEGRVAGEIGLLLDQVDVPEQHPLDGLLEAVHRAGNMARALEVLVRQLDQDPSVTVEIDEGPRGGETRRTIVLNNPLYGPDHLGDGKPHVLVEMLAKWTELHAKATKLALDAGIDERRLELAHGQAEIMATVLRTLVRHIETDVIAELLAAMPSEARSAGQALWQERWPKAARAALETMRTKEVLVLDRKEVQT